MSTTYCKEKISYKVKVYTLVFLIVFLALITIFSNKKLPNEALSFGDKADSEEPDCFKKVSRKQKEPAQILLSKDKVEECKFVGCGDFFN